jgi:hypothetical protein
MSVPQDSIEKTIPGQRPAKERDPGRVRNLFLMVILGIALVLSIYVYCAYDRALGGLQFVESFAGLNRLESTISTGLTASTFPLSFSLGLSILPASFTEYIKDSVNLRIFFRIKFEPLNVPTPMLMVIPHLFSSTASKRLL